MTIAETLLAELERESVATREILSRVPPAELEWRPHEKSMSLGDLAWHIASIPRVIAERVRDGGFDVGSARPPKRTGSDFAGELQRSLDAARAALAAISDSAMFEPFTLRRGDSVIQSFPRIGAVRSILLNHSYHHRGQLTVYLRLLGVPLPPVYGTSADESAFT
jgi:uncharacterized damage-inducible protein DinB